MLVILLSDLNNNFFWVFIVGKIIDVCMLGVGNYIVLVLVCIIDYLFEWCYFEGGVKVFIIGEWKME